MADQTRQSFNAKFWNQKENCLFDVIDKTADPSIRPNQIFAVSLDYTMLDNEKSQRVVETVNRELVTPYGLKTLSVRKKWREPDDSITLAISSTTVSGARRR